jgi:hypothetical protein
MTIMKAASRELRKPFILIPETKKSASMIVQAFIIKLNNPKVRILKGNVISSSNGFSNKFTQNSTKPIISRSGISSI